MQKYLSVKNRLRKRQPQEQSAFIRLRRQLQAQGQISKELLQAALSYSKLPAIREVLLFCRYDELKSLLDPHISPEDLSQHAELGRIYRLNVAQREKEQGKSGPAEGLQPSSREGKRRRKIMLAIAVGIGLFVLFFLLRSRWRQAVSRLLQK